MTSNLFLHTLRERVRRSAVDITKMTIVPLSSSVNIVTMGSQSGLSPNDVISLNKAYSCAGRVYTNGGGNLLVWYSTILHSFYLYVFDGTQQ
jgi:hypothetical protein